MNEAAVLTLAAARQAIDDGSVDLLTSDVFDTLVWRPVSKPHQLFPRIAARLHAADILPATVDGDVFAHGRRRAERLARDRSRRGRSSVECTIEEIWAEMPSSWIGRMPTDELVEHELAVERAALRPHPAAVSLVEAAIARRVPVCLVSDTYLSSDQLRALLVDVGVDLAADRDRVQVVTSASAGRNKWEGLLDDVLAARSVQPACALHLGDHPISDVEVAKRAGARAARAAIADQDDAVANAADPWRRHATATASDGGRDAVTRETLLRADRHATDASYQFGVAVAGPLMAGFCRWVDTTARDLGATTVHCLLREGARIAELIETVVPEPLDRVLVHASRWAMMRATVFEGSPVELQRALERRDDFSASQVTAAFGCDQADVERVIGAVPYRGWARIGAWEAIADDDSLRSQIVEASARLRVGVRAYLERTLRLDTGPLVLCDIGWGGRIQEGITAVLREGGHTGGVVGLYSMLSPAGDERAGAGADLRGYLPTVGIGGQSIEAAAVAIRNCEFLERINTPAIGTLLGFDDDGVPICRPDDHDRPSASLTRAQTGVVDFCRTWRELVLPAPGVADEWSRGDFAAPSLAALAAVIAAPDRRLAADLTMWEHDDLAGDGAETLAHPDFARWAPFGNVAELAEIEMNEMFWTQGAAAATSAPLGAQFTALAAGVDPHALCPPSAAGQARVAAFPPGSPLAAAQLEVVPRSGTDGWMLLRFDTPIDGLRSVRIDLGEVALLAEVGDVEIVVETEAGPRPLIDGIDQLDRGRWVGRGGWIGHGRCAVDAGAHLVIELDPTLASAVTHCRVRFAYRAWPVAADEVAALVPRWRVTLDRARRRVADQTNRRRPPAST